MESAMFLSNENVIAKEQKENKENVPSCDTDNVSSGSIPLRPLTGPLAASCTTWIQSQCRPMRMMIGVMDLMVRRFASDSSQICTRHSLSRVAHVAHGYK
jgi:hypothetical protein